MAVQTDFTTVALPLSGTPGQELVAFVTYTPTGTPSFAAGNTFVPFSIPATTTTNIVIYDVIVDFANLGANTAIEVGDNESATKFISSTATTSAGKATLNSLNRGTAYSAADDIVITNSGSGAIGSDQINVTVHYGIAYPN